MSKYSALIFAWVFCSCVQKTPNVAETSLAATPDTLPVYPVLKIDSLLIGQITAAFRLPDTVAGKINAFYRDRDFNCAWFNNHGLTEQAGNVVNLVRDYVESGAFQSEHLLPGVVALHDSVSEPDFTPVGNEALVKRADVIFTLQFIRFADEVWKGTPDKAEKLAWFIPVKSFSQFDYLSEFFADTAARVQGHEPVYRQYALLVEKMKLYMKLEKEGGWKKIPVPETALQPGQQDSLVVAVRRRLHAVETFSGDTNSIVYDSAFAAIITSVRTCYGLSGDRIDKALIGELNVPVTERLRTMALNLERWKWVPPDPGADFIAVNIPEFMLHVFENGKVVKNMRVIVGKTVNQTVIFSGNIKTIVMSPYWVVPRSIIVKETLPALKRNRNYLAGHRMELFTNTNPPRVVNPASIDFSKYSGASFPYGVRQKPGPNNSLGKVKFLFPNSYSIYLHDTPVHSLFEKDERNFSHGCVRLSEPAWLAEYLLRNNKAWSPEKIEKAMNMETETYVTLEKPVPVYITYFTSWVDSNDMLHFRDDIYGHDRKLAAMLFNN